MPRVSSGEPTSVDAEVDPHPPLRLVGVGAEGRHERREGFVEPDTLPPFHRHQVTEPHVCDLVVDDLGDALAFGQGRRLGVDQQGGLAVGDQSQVLHRAETEVGNRNHVELVARVGDREVVREEAQGEGPGVEGHVGEVTLAQRVDDAQRYAVDVDFGGLLEGTDDEGHQVGGHDHRGREGERAPSVAEVGRGGLGGVGVRRQVRGHRQINLPGGLEGRLVPAREGASCVGVLELGGGDGVDLAILSRERGTVETHEKVVQDAGEGDLECGVAHRQRLIEGEGRRLVLRVVGRFARAKGGRGR